MLTRLTRPTHERVRARRRVAVRIGLALLALAWTAIGATACIFEKGNYQGGGRKDQGAEGTTATPSGSTAPTTTGTLASDGALLD